MSEMLTNEEIRGYLWLYHNYLLSRWEGHDVANPMHHTPDCECDRCTLTFRTFMFDVYTGARCPESGKRIEA